MSKPIVISDPFPRTLDLIFTKKKLIELKKKYKVLIEHNKKKRKFGQASSDTLKKKIQGSFEQIIGSIKILLFN